MESGNNEISVETLIAGGGPAGSTCGIALQKAGKDVLIVDKAEFPRLKLCAGVLTGKSQEVLKTLLGNEVYESVLDNTLMASEKHLRLWDRKKCMADVDFGDKEMLPKSLCNSDCSIKLVNRPSFDAFLINYYKNTGGKTILGDGIKSVDFTNHRATLTSGKIICYKYLVAADGATSHIEHLLKQFDKSFEGKSENALAYEINVDRKDLDIDGVNVCFGFVPHTYAWLFAKGEKVCIGTCKLQGRKFDGKAAMEDICKTYGLKNIDHYPLQGAMIPFDNRMKNPLWHDEVFFVGDAAGLDEAVTGEGIYYALKSGFDTATSIKKGTPLLYLELIAHTHQILKKGARYQKLLEHKLSMRFFKRVVKHHPHFLSYFYLTQIDHTSLRHFPKIMLDFIRER